MQIEPCCHKQSDWYQKGEKASPKQTLLYCKFYSKILFKKNGNSNLKKKSGRTGKGVLTIIPELFRYLGVVGSSHYANLYFPPQSLQKLIELLVDFLQMIGKYL